MGYMSRGLVWEKISNAPIVLIVTVSKTVVKFQDCKFCIGPKHIFFGQPPQRQQRTTEYTFRPHQIVPGHYNTTSRKLHNTWCLVVNSEKVTSKTLAKWVDLEPKVAAISISCLAVRIFSVLLCARNLYTTGRLSKLVKNAEVINIHFAQSCRMSVNKCPAQGN